MTQGSICAEQTGAEETTTEPLCPPNSPVTLRTIVYGPQNELENGPSGFAALKAEWNTLLQRSRFNTIFLTYEWQTTWWEYMGEGDLWLLAMRRTDNDELVGIVPLYLSVPTVGRWTGKRRLNWVGCIEISDYLDLIAAQEWEEAVYTAFYAWLHSDAAPQWDVLDLCNLPQDSLTYTVFTDMWNRDEFDVRVAKEDTAPQFPLPMHYDTYLQERVEKKQRHEIRRKQRRVERETDARFYFVEQGDDLAAEMDDFAMLQRASREDKAEFMTPEMRRFFGVMAQRMQDAGYLRLCFLTLNGQKAACLLAFEYNKRYLLYNSGYDPDAYAHLSPGWVLLAYTIQYAIAIGCEVFDFMQGDEEYKYRFGSDDYDVMRVVVARHT